MNKYFYSAWFYSIPWDPFKRLPWDSFKRLPWIIDHHDGVPHIASFILII